MMDTVRTIEKVISYIEENIKEKISLDSISYDTYISKYHLHRIFKTVTNKSLMQYVRNRKLAHTIQDLLNSNEKIIDIALKYNFEHEQSYIRSFKNTFNISPAKLRKERNAVEIVDKINVKSFTAIAGGVVIEPTIIIKPQFYLVGEKNKIYYSDNRENSTANKAGREFFYNCRDKIQNPKYPDVYIGLTEYGEPYDEYSFYMPSIEVKNLKNIPDSMVGKTILTNKYAVFKYISFSQPSDITILDLISIYDYAHNQWLPNSYYDKVDNFHFERIDENLSREDYCEVDIYLPIVESDKKDNKKINRD